MRNECASYGAEASQPVAEVKELYGSVRNAPFCPQHDLVVWPQHLAPKGDASNGVVHESFLDWWSRCKYALANLDSMICEQWVHRHWFCSPHRYIKLEELGWRSEIWSASEFLENVGSSTDDGLRDRSQLAEYYDPKTHQPHQSAQALEKGSWDFPPIVLGTPHGFVDQYKRRISLPYLLIEGHLRYGCLKALVDQGHKFKSQRVFVIT